MKLAIISDTHLPRGRRGLPESCVERLRAAEAVLHAGDISSAAALAELQAIAPRLIAVHGNVDDAAVQAQLPVERVVDLDGVSVAVIHDAGPAAGRMARLRGRFAEADAVVFGHSHIPLHETGPDGLQIFNPGSPTDRRRQRHHTMGLARTRDGRIAFEIVTLD